MSTPFEPFGTGLEQGPPPPVSMAQAAAGHVAQATRWRNRRVSEQEMEAFESIFENVKGGSLELFSRLSPQGRTYFIQLAGPHLLLAGADNEICLHHACPEIRDGTLTGAEPFVTAGCDSSIDSVHLQIDSVAFVCPDPTLEFPMGCGM